MEFISKDEDKLDRWLNTKVWIIDEVSMVDARLFEKLATIGSFLRKDDRPFGGIQLVLCGDFFQVRPCRAMLSFFSRLTANDALVHTSAAAGRQARPTDKLCV